MFKNLATKISYAGEVSSVCEAGLHAIFRCAVSVQILIQIKKIDDLAKITCGMGVVVGKDVDFEILIANHSPELDLVPSEEALIRLGIYADAYSRENLRILCTDEALDKGLSLAANDGESFILLTDSTGEKIILVWKTPLDLLHYDPVLCTVSWDYGDPRKIVERFEKNYFKLRGKSCAEAEVAQKLINTFKSIPIATVPFTEPVQPTTPSCIGVDLYPHQDSAVETWLLNGCRGIFEMCTGAGKTITALAAIHRIPEVHSERCPVLVSVPTRVLADQWIDEVTKMGFSKPLQAYESAANWISVLGPWFKADTREKRRIVVTTYASMSDERFMKRIEDVCRSGTRGLWIADEMHNLASGKLLELMERIGNAFPLRIGLSATPEIEGNERATRRLYNFFGNPCAEYLLENGIRDGVLCPYNYFPIPTYLSPKLGNKYLKMLAEIESTERGSPKLLELYRQSREAIRTSGVQTRALRDILGNLVQEGKSLTHTLIYCPAGYTKTPELTDTADPGEIKNQKRFLEEVVAVVREFDSNVTSIIGETPKQQRDIRLKKFGEGSCDVLCAIGCLDEGVDVPSIQRAIVLSSIDRERQFIQRRGRILRKPRGVNKIAEIIDLVILPQGGDVPAADAARLLEKEMRRYRVFSELSLNHSQAKERIEQALSVATQEILI